MKLSIVIPALNEEKTVAICVKKAFKAIKNLNIEGEVIIADNGSVDDTVKFAEDARARVINVPKRGYGSALIGGFQASRGEFLVMGDADDTYNFEEIATFVEKLKEGYDFVIGNRFKGKIEKGAMPFLNRYLGTPVLTWIMNLFFKTGIGDVNCGMRALKKEAFTKMHLKAVGMEFATEMIVKASLRKLKVAEIPCNLYKGKKGRKPHLNIWLDGWRHLRFMLLFTPSWTFLAPGLTLSVVGFGGMTVLSLRDGFVLEKIAFITQKHMLSCMLLFLLGSQILSFGLAAQAFSFSKYFDYASKSIKFLHKYFKLEKGILCGSILILLSVCLFIYLFVSYYIGVFPYLTNLVRFDLTVFAIAFFILGIQLIYLSFLLSLFYLKVK